MGPSSQSGDVAENSSLYGQGERWVLLQVPRLRSGFRACLPGAQPCELCCGAEQAVDPLLIKQQQRCCTLGGVFCTGFAPVTREGCAGAAVPWSYRTRTRPRGHNMLLKWPRRNAADSSPIYGDVLRAGFWLGCAAVLLPEAKEPDFICGGCSLQAIL